jgi:tight adherence protein B
VSAPEFWLIPMLVFAAVLLGVQAIYRLVSRSRRTKKAIDRRLADTKAASDSTDRVDALRAERGLAEIDHRLVQAANDFLVQTGLKMDRTMLLFVTVALAAAFFLAWALILGRGLSAVLLSAVSAPCAVVVFLRTARQRRIARFAELLPDSIDVIIRAVRVGYPLPVAFGLVAREMPDPIGAEFAITADEITFGQDVRTAIENLFRRVGQEDLLFLVLAIKVQSQTGGNLAEILARLSRLMRNRTKLQLKIRALSADGRISALVLSLMPFILLGGILLISPGYFAEIRDHPLVEPALVYGVLSLVIGNIVMYRMVNFRF